MKPKKLKATELWKNLDDKQAEKIREGEVHGECKTTTSLGATGTTFTWKG